LSWRDIKQETRDIVHETMGLPAVYDDGSDEPIECSVRHHRRTAFIGDDIEDFSPGILSQINRVILDKREIESPVRNATLTFDDGTVLKIDVIVQQGENYVMCEVKQ
jgi:hypothetical protein